MRERRWGRIINISGLDAFWGEPGRAHVVASKLGIVGLTRALALECAKEGVTVNCIVPGVMDTDRHSRAWWPDVERFYEQVRPLIPMGRLGTIDELGEAAHFLASDMASYLTGQTLFVTGGAFPMTNGLAKS
jgi:NAD(P)-dependent dehydrogenase (short-subunit alcohol dehydrogenase family)